MQLKLKNIISPSYSLIFLFAILAALIWSATYAGALFVQGTSFNELWQVLSAQPGNGSIWKNTVSFVLTMINSVLLARLISRFSFVHARTFLPVFTFVLLVTVWEPSHIMYQSHLSLLLFIGALFQFFNMYQNQEATEKSFLASLLIAGASLIINDLIFVIPVCWLGFIILRSFSLRTFLASLLGALTPWILYCAIRYVFSPASFELNDLFSIHFTFGFSMEELMIPTKIYIGLLFVMFFVSLVGTYADFHKKANSTRKNMNFTLLLLIYFIIVFLLHESFDGTIFPFIALCFSIFISNVYSIRKNNFYLGLFLLFLAANFLFIIFNFIW